MAKEKMDGLCIGVGQSDMSRTGVSAEMMAGGRQKKKKICSADSTESGTRARRP